MYGTQTPMGCTHSEVRSATTPTMGTRRLLMCAMRPTIWGSERNRLRQMASLMMATGICPGAAQSEASSRRPRSGAIQSFDEEEIAGDGEAGSAGGIVIADQSRNS